MRYLDLARAAMAEEGIAHSIGRRTGWATVPPPAEAQLPLPAPTPLVRRPAEVEQPDERNESDEGSARTDRARLTADPRPDLEGDSEPWQELLGLAYDRDGDRSDGLFGALHGFRCWGARLVAGHHTARLTPGEIGDEYPRLRDEYLAPHAEALTALLQQLAR